MDHLRQLKRDPYYYEAMLRLHRKRQLVHNRPGSLPSKVGELAGKLQRPPTPRTLRKRGHPQNKELDGLRVLAKFLAEYSSPEKLNIPLRELCRRYVKREYPNSPIEQREKFIRKFYGQVRELLRPKRRKVAFSSKNPLPSWTLVPTFNRKPLSAKFRAR